VLGKLMGMDWRMTVALVSSFPARENAIATLGDLFGSSPKGSPSQALTAAYSTASALSCLVVTLLFITCMATVTTIRQEIGLWRWTLLNIGLRLVISFGAGIAFYHIALLLRL